MKLYIIHHYHDCQYEEFLEIKAICTNEDKAEELCNKFNEECDRARYYYEIIESDVEFDDSILKC